MLRFSAAVNVYRCPSIHSQQSVLLLQVNFISPLASICHLQSRRKSSKNSEAYGAAPFFYMALGGLVFLAYVTASFYGANNDTERTVNIYAKLTFRELNCFLSCLKISDFILNSIKSAEFSDTNWVILPLSAVEQRSGPESYNIILKTLIPANNGRDALTSPYSTVWRNRT